MTWFDTRGDAATRYLRVSGLAGLVDVDDPAVGPGLRAEHGRWRLAMDPAASGAGAPDMAQLIARSRAPVALARGERDSMSTPSRCSTAGISKASDRDKRFGL